MYYQRLPLETTYNTRDLGGIPTKNGQIVTWKKLFRSDDVSRLSASDRRFLKEYGVGVAIDLRSRREREETNYTLEEETSIETYHVPFM
ncbi:tyrosine-protein phosphatase [Enterococcus sp. AZ101]|uniref:tyrosine-protein phosphatase n=1 Tax=Enterococcus sp. AZ101 TaxID=2774742 RepID=UPI003D28A941